MKATCVVLKVFEGLMFYNVTCFVVVVFFAFVCLLPSSLSDLQASRDTTLQNSGVERDYLFFFSRLIYSLHTKHVISVRFNLLLTLFVQ